MVRTRCFSRMPFFGNRVLVDNSFKYNSTTVINFGSGWGGCYQPPKYNGWNFVADLCQGILTGIGFAAMYGRCYWGGGAGGRTQVQTQPQTTNSSYDKDPKKIQDYLIEIEKYTGKTTLTEADKTGVKSLYKDIKARAEGMNHEDDIDSATNTKAYKLLLGKLTDKFDFDSDGNPTIKGASNPEVKPEKPEVKTEKPEVKTESDKYYDDLLKNETWNNASIPASGYLEKTEFPEGMEFATANDDFSKMKLMHAHDAFGTTKDVEAKVKDSQGNVSYISSKKVQGFPEYLIITDTKGSYKYHMAGIVDGKAIYNTPTSDTNNNHYVLMKRGNELYLRQCGNIDDKNNKSNMKGFGYPDKQCG